MAARLHPAPSGPQAIDLRRLRVDELEPLLREEVAAWRQELDWDFEKSAELVRRFVDMRALNGHALYEQGRVTAYSYYVLEDSKGLLGDLYVQRGLRGMGREDLLLKAALAEMLSNRHILRVESQLLMLPFDARRRVPSQQYAAAFERNYMRIDFGGAALDEGQVRHPMYLEKWADHYQDAASHLIAAAYRGHIDSRINDQYRSADGARRFLYNIVQYPGCGSFFRPASFAAFDSTGRMCGVSLASLVSTECGHITQICVAPEVKGTGIGHALLRRSLLTLRDLGCRSASLTVTAANRGAVALYERAGFRTIRKFSAYAWEGW